jgi:HAD superfamily hydrolase (TIGR01509 family)
VVNPQLVDTQVGLPVGDDRDQHIDRRAATVEMNDGLADAAELADDGSKVLDGGLPFLEPRGDLGRVRGERLRTSDAPADRIVELGLAGEGADERVYILAQQTGEVRHGDELAAPPPFLQVLESRCREKLGNPGHAASFPQRRRLSSPVAVEAVIFDLDGVLIDSEAVWNGARRALTLERGGRWGAGAPRAMMGMSSIEWSRYMHDELGVDLSPQEISALVVARLEELYRREVPLLPGAREAVTRLAGEWPLGLASSANRPIIDLVLERAELAPFFAATVSSEEVARGKPAPDVYLEAARRLGVPPQRCAAVEDSTNGLRSAAGAGTAVIAVPNREFPPSEEALSLASVVIASLSELDAERVLAAVP